MPRSDLWYDPGTTLVALNKVDARQPNGTGLARRIEGVHELLTKRTPSRCRTPNVTLNCLGPPPAPSGASSPLAYHSCAGVAWQRCLVVHNYQACPKVRLSGWTG